MPVQGRRAEAWQPEGEWLGGDLTVGGGQDAVMHAGRVLWGGAPLDGEDGWGMGG